jgi:hypothetical protein
MLADFDKPTDEQPISYFACHATTEFICHGWAVVHGRQEDDHDLLGLRVLAAMGAFDYDDLAQIEEGVPLFSSGTEAAEHGKRDILNPSRGAQEVVARLAAKYERLRFS